jgi:hypothetical protein
MVVSSTKGFSVQNWAFVESGATQSFFFDTGLNWNELSPKDKRECDYVRQHKGGILTYPITLCAIHVHITSGS